MFPCSCYSSWDASKKKKKKNASVYWNKGNPLWALLYGASLHTSRQRPWCAHCLCRASEQVFHGKSVVSGATAVEHGLLPKDVLSVNGGDSLCQSYVKLLFNRLWRITQHVVSCLPYEVRDALTVQAFGHEGPGTAGTELAPDSVDFVSIILTIKWHVSYRRLGHVLIRHYKVTMCCGKKKNENSVQYHEWQTVTANWWGQRIVGFNTPTGVPNVLILFHTNSAQ